ncbi:LPXTG cell wall anchor domain-containing protein [Streptomyces sp. RB17]|uniref:LPXTG cell wall anchor domain-containing protein n=1 Tax=Streptomyces sp. RB17 TaxID=2585197 RepID=UPI0018866961|nr:LPXTG cell wall anchor domain-containing protein [Streptomyces sp. RB17]
MASAMRAIEQAQDAVRTAHRDAGMTEEAAPESRSSLQRSSAGSGSHGDDEPSHKPSQSYGDDDKPSYGKSGSYGDDDKPGYGKSGSYGDDESSYGSSYGGDEHCGCYGEEEKPPPPHRHVPPPQHHKPPQTPPHRHVPPPQHHTPPQMAHTGSEGTITAAAAGGVLLVAGTVLYRRGRRAATQK